MANRSVYQCDNKAFLVGYLDECGGKYWYRCDCRDPCDITLMAIDQWGLIPVQRPESERACRMGDCKGEPVSMCQSNSSE